MKRGLDRLDALVAAGLFAAVSGWAFLWAHPYPHPALWSFLALFRPFVAPSAFGVAGRLVLGVFAALAYLLMRTVWIGGRADGDTAPDRFLYARLMPLFGALAFTFFPLTWRAGQFLSLHFALLVAAMVGFLFWLCGRAINRIVLCIFAYLIFGFVTGMHPLGVATLTLAWTMDAVLWWRVGMAFEEGEDGEIVNFRRRVQVVMSVAAVAMLIGFGLGLWGRAMLAAAGTGQGTFPAKVLAWWGVWSGEARAVRTSTSVWAMGFSVCLAVLGISAGRRLRSLGVVGTLACDAFAAVMGFIVAIFLFRAIDRPERLCLAAIRDYVSLVAEDAADVKYLFTDGRFDDALRMEFVTRGRDVVLLNAMSVPDDNEAKRLRGLAPEPTGKSIFEAGGAEVFKTWARERPERFSISAWQLGSGLLRRFGKVKPRTHGTVFRCAAAVRQAADEAADARFARWSRHLLAVAERSRACSALFGEIDGAVRAKLDAVLWRSSRMAVERADRLKAAADPAEAEGERELRLRMDRQNASLCAQSEVVERMLATGKMVLTPREALEVALKRADFTLARGYAVKVLAEAPDDPQANFALGMAKMEEKDYFAASVHFEKALERNQNEPASLNNLAITAIELGDLPKALHFAERASKALPQSTEVRQTLAEVKRRLQAQKVLPPKDAAASGRGE